MLRLAAAFIFFTRLPFWRIACPPLHYYKTVIQYWAYTGLLTSAFMAGTLLLFSSFIRYDIAVLIAISTRLLITGALHEDGLADFIDGFGGGKDKTSIMLIMKDSHIGTYGVISLIIYFICIYTTLSSMPVSLSIPAILVADPLNKYIASFIIFRLPYARSEKDSKSGIVYSGGSIVNLLIGLVLVTTLVVFLLKGMYWICILSPIIVFYFLTIIMKQKINGYTGDCCGAVFLLCELSFFISISIIMNLYGNISC